MSARHNRSVPVAILLAGMPFVSTLHAADDFTLAADESYTVSEKTETYGNVDIRGTLTVPSGKTFQADTNWFGSTGSAVINVNGGTYGKSSSTPSSGSGTNNVYVGTDGGNATVNLTGSGSTFKFNSLYVQAAATPHASGYIDLVVASGAGDKAFSAQWRHNKTSHTNRIQVLEGRLKDSINNMYYYGSRYGAKCGHWLYEVASGAYIRLVRTRHGSFNETSNTGSSITVRGDGTAEIDADGGDSGSVWGINKGVTFANAGGITFLSGSKNGTRFADGVVFTDTFGTMKNVDSKHVQFSGDVNLGNMTVTSTGRFMATSGKSPTITFGTANRDATLTGEVFAEDCALTLVKTGTGTLTTSATTPFVPELSLDAGALVIQGATFCSNLTAAAGTSITVDGGTWTVEGDQLTQAVGSTLSCINGGAIIVKKVGDKAPAFAPGSTVPVSEYWIDGEKQANGNYALGEATLEVRNFDPFPTDAVWTNEGKAGETFAFPAYDEYLGFELVKTDAPLTFTGGTVVLGASGIAVEETDTAAAFTFDMPIFACATQTWAFGAASAVFSKPFTQVGTKHGGKITLTSTADITLATTNSTFNGALAVTAHTISVSGNKPFGDCTAVSLAVSESLGSGWQLTMRDVTCPQTFSVVRCKTSADHLFFAGTNSLQTMYFGDDRNGARYLAGSETTWNGAVQHYNYNFDKFGSGSRAVFKKPCDFWGYAGSTSYGVAPLNNAAIKPVLRFEAQNTVRDKMKDGYGVDYYPLTFYGQQYNSGLRLELAADHAFSRGWFRVEGGVEIDLCGYNQGMTMLTGGAAEITSDTPANLELAVPADSNIVVNCVFTGQAGFAMAGAGSATLATESPTSGGLVVTNGTLTLATAWPNATSVAVANGGRLLVTEEKALPKTETMSLAGVGALTLPTAASRLRVTRLTLANPSTGETVTYTTGEFDSSNSWGLIAQGTLRVGRRGFSLLLK